jgi:hypothetical protein
MKTAPGAEGGDMSTFTLDIGPVLVSELPPPLPVRPSAFARYRAELAARREVRAFERAARNVGHAEYADLIAIRRRG